MIWAEFERNKTFKGGGVIDLPVEEELYIESNALSITNEADATTGIYEPTSTTATSSTTPAPQEGTHLIVLNNIGNVNVNYAGLTIGKEYAVKYWAWAESGSSGYSNAWLNATGSAYHDFTTTPTQYTQIITAANTGITMRFYVGGGTECYLDGMSIMEVLVPVTGVVVTPSTASVGVATTTALSRTIAPINATNKTGAWTSSNESLATVNQTGVVTGVGLGDVSITYTTIDGSFTDSTLITVSSEITQSLKAFPEAEGFGRNTVGGRGGTTIYVTNLNDSGAGSLREACEASGERTVLFSVGGLINLLSTINITNPFISILAQSAPGDGIYLTTQGVLGQRPIQVSADEVIIRYVGVRAITGSAGNSGVDGIYIQNGTNIILDHCSVAFASDELIGINHLTANPTKNITIQWCMITNAFGGSSSKGALCAKKIEGLSFYMNLFASNITRNPYLSPQDQNPDFDLQYEVINNVIYNCKYYIECTRVDSVDNGGTGIPQFNVINNIGILSTGLPYAKNTQRNMVLNYSELPVEIYVKGNIHPDRPLVAEPVDWVEEWSTTQGGDGEANKLNPAFAAHQVFVPHDTPIVTEGATILDADILWDNIKVSVGASYPSRDSHDVQMVDETETGNRADDVVEAILPTYNNVNNSTPAYTDSNNDGIDDAWFAANVPNGDTALDTNVIGYTYLEEFLNQIYN
tara:strand:- start:2947 stop:5031 length:2085 start_codon:yes stop_codon:yes gene_type:complete